MALPLKITSERSHALHDIAATRLLEDRAQARNPDPSLMQRAGLATARLALALAPHARHIWIACGPGNNGGDGFEAALALHRLGKAVSLTWTGLGLADVEQPKDAEKARMRAQTEGLQISSQPPAQFDLAIDALLGIGGALKPASPSSALMAGWLRQMDQTMHQGAPVLSIDLPTGLDADTGMMRGLDGDSSLTRVSAAPLNLRHTLSLLTLKPGLFTADGRDWAGQVWLDDLGVVAKPADCLPCAFLQGQDAMQNTRHRGPHASHKGSYGDVAILGGETFGSDQSEKVHDNGRCSMAGAALLAARAALQAGAGRVYVALVGTGGPLNDAIQPELMFRVPEMLDFAQQVVVCGCGGGRSIRQHLPAVLSAAKKLVLDADALNAVAEDDLLPPLVAARAGLGFSTVITPHPLEAARLLDKSAAEVQADRRGAAQMLAERFSCVVLLKGSGSVIAGPGQTTVINHSGNAALATAGTGDVLAGLVGAALARGLDAWAAATQSCFQHGQVADEWLRNSACETSFTASKLAERLHP
jgi:hydroxyethylthiazole kinase-like uncharacterized protein yjeF